jgi:hypothetical protein
MKTTAVKGKYYPKNKSKTPHTSCIYRSLWERRFMIYCDKSPHVHYWINEPFAIPYITNNKSRNYYPDFLVRLDDGRTKLIEIKPSYQKSWQQNRDKWYYAEEYCKKNHITFQVLTETELF